MTGMFFRAAVLGLAMVQPTFAGDNNPIEITSAFARASTPLAKAGAAFLEITNNGTEPDRLVAVETPAAKRAELHTHVMSDGVMQMRHDEDGFDLPAGGAIVMQRGGDHVMLMGLTTGLSDGDAFPLTLIFETAAPVTIDVTVDLSR